jgi:putative transposase
VPAHSIPSSASANPCDTVYLRAYETVAEARRLIGRYLDFFNTKRPHSSLGGRTPDHAYFAQVTPLATSCMNFAVT